MTSREPRLWSSDELAAAAREATERFISHRLGEGIDLYAGFYEESANRIEKLFAETNELREGLTDLVVDDPTWLTALRYLAGPPVSADDLRTIVGDRLSGRSLDDDVAARVIDTVLKTLDPFRFSWVAEGRGPTEGERLRAVGWTAGLLTVEKLRTHRRNAEAVEQEDEVKAVLTAAGFTRVDRPGQELTALDRLERGTYTDELKIAGTKADVPVRLFDGRLLAIECKASNSAVNSIKRLNREAGGKADHWRSAFGRQIVPCAVISGVFDTSTLVKAQDEQGVFIVWQHDLDPLSEFVRAAR